MEQDDRYRAAVRLKVKVITGLVALTLILTVILSALVNDIINKRRYTDTSGLVEYGTIEIRNPTPEIMRVEIYSPTYEKGQRDTLITENGTCTLPLSLGSGDYTIELLEDWSGVLLYTRNVKLMDGCEDKLYLSKNSYVNWNNSEGTAFNKLYSEVESQSDSQAEFIHNSYGIAYRLEYDKDLKEQVLAGSIETYSSTIEDTLKKGKGVCLEKASLLAGLLREHKIPTKLVWGDYNGAFHAWIEYSTDNGWVLLDPTLGEETLEKDYTGQYTY